MDFSEIRIFDYVSSASTGRIYKIIDMCRLGNDALPIKDECVMLVDIETCQTSYDAVSDIRPIEITDDILKLNGFVKSDDSIEWRTNLCDGNLLMTCFANTIGSGSAKGAYRFDISGWNKEGLFRQFKGDIRYVHDLQNVMNDIHVCGFNVSEKQKV